MGSVEDQNKPGTDSGESQQQLSSRQSQTNNQSNNQDKQPSLVLQQSLKQWSRIGDSGGAQPPLRAWQQFQALQEDNQTMLRRRFEIEDSQTEGLVENKPW